MQWYCGHLHLFVKTQARHIFPASMRVCGRDWDLVWRRWRFLFPVSFEKRHILIVPGMSGGHKQGFLLNWQRAITDFAAQFRQFLPWNRTWDFLWFGFLARKKVSDWNARSKKVFFSLSRRFSHKLRTYTQKIVCLKGFPNCRHGRSLWLWSGEWGRCQVVFLWRLRRCLSWLKMSRFLHD